MVTFHISLLNKLHLEVFCNSKTDSSSVKTCSAKFCSLVKTRFLSQQTVIQHFVNLWQLAGFFTLIHLLTRFLPPIYSVSVTITFLLFHICRFQSVMDAIISASLSIIIRTNSNIVVFTFFHFTFDKWWYSPRLQGSSFKAIVFEKGFIKVRYLVNVS